MIDQRWLELREYRERKYSRKTWVPLRAVTYPILHGRFPEIGHKEEFFAIGSVAFPLHDRKAADCLGWDEIGLNGHGPILDGQHYVPTGEWVGFGEQPKGLALVLDQGLQGEDLPIWHLHQDLVFALKLKREGNVWVCPEEGYEVAARIHYQGNGSPTLIEMRSDFLRDYLCVREMGLYLTSYSQRRAVIGDLVGYSQPEGVRQEESEGGRWTGSVSAITKDGDPFGAGVMVLHIARTDASREDDIPELEGSPTDSNTISSSESFSRCEGKRYLLMGEAWKNEWIEPAASSSRVRGDKTHTPCYYLTDLAGGRSSSEDLAGGGKWIWFRPEVIEALMGRRGGGLTWSSREIGRVHCSPGYEVTFGVNSLGLVVVYAKDIVRLPAWQQQIWAACNTHPDGGLPEELFHAQVEGYPSGTQSPESRLKNALKQVSDGFIGATGLPLFTEHPERPRIQSLAHRFRSTTPESFVALAKDLARLIGDSLDRAALNHLVSPPKQEKWGSIKSLEKVLSEVLPPEEARNLLTPLVGVWELRHADAHLPGSDRKEQLDMARMDTGLPYVWQGARLIEVLAEVFEGISGHLPELAKRFKK